ncbi:hypothetical protein CONCODRAFT_13734, partial [Conidiobolus coronatus NRRL 28638]
MNSSDAFLLAIIILLTLGGFALIFICAKLHFWYLKYKDRKVTANTNIGTRENNLNNTQINIDSRLERVNLTSLALQIEDPLPPYERS